CVLEPTEQENITNIADTEMLPENELYIQQLTNSDYKLLKKFRDEINKCVHRYCPICKERFTLITLVKGEYRRCYTEKGEIKKFSFANNMDPDILPEELTGLTKIEEMLIAQIFPVVSIYYLRSGQYAYHGNVINFSQDVNEFVTQLPRHSSSLRILVVRHQSVRGQQSFREFNVRRDKVGRALCWLKANNRYYKNIVIDENALQSLPEDGALDSQLSQMQNIVDKVQNEISNSYDKDDDNDDLEDVITHSFVPTPAPSYNKEFAINDSLN
ncbi:5060_t:CDS:1, partial [Gigaspora rosea]